jgi:hypothetical protein
VEQRFPPFLMVVLALGLDLRKGIKPKTAYS